MPHTFNTAMASELCSVILLLSPLITLAEEFSISTGPTDIETLDAVAGCMRRCAVNKYEITDDNTFDRLHDIVDNCLDSAMSGGWACHISERLISESMNELSGYECGNVKRAVVVSSSDCTCRMTSMGYCPSPYMSLQQVKLVRGTMATRIGQSF